MSNLKLQKLLYFAQMVALGEHDDEIVHDDFQAWALGPVNAELYHEVKIYGSSPVGSLPTTSGPEPSGLGRYLLDETLRSLGDRTVGDLIRISHWPEGAWAKNYVRGDRHRIIPKTDIAKEYRKRKARVMQSEDGQG